MNRKQIMLDISTACNARCFYCLPQNHGLIQPHLMAKSTFNIIADILKKEKFQLVHLYMSGEPFLHPSISYFIKTLVKRKIDISIATKLGIPIDFKSLNDALSIADRTRQYVEFVITIDSVTPNLQLEIAPGIKTELVLNNLKEMAKLRDSHKSFKYTCQTVVNKFNEGELDNTRRELKNLGFDNWSPKYMGYYWGYIADKDDIKLITSLLPSINYQKRFKIENDKIVSFQEKCPFPNDPAISYDGNVTICCHDILHKLNLGNVLEQKSIKKIIESKEFLKIKEDAENMLLEICKGCN